MTEKDKWYIKIGWWIAGLLVIGVYCFAVDFDIVPMPQWLYTAMIIYGIGGFVGLIAWGYVKT